MVPYLSHLQFLDVFKFQAVKNYCYFCFIRTNIVLSLYCIVVVLLPFCSVQVLYHRLLPSISIIFHVEQSNQNTTMHYLHMFRH